LFCERFGVSTLRVGITGSYWACLVRDVVFLAGDALAAGLIAAGLFRWDSAARRIAWRLIAPGLVLWLALGAGTVWHERERARPPADTAAVISPDAFVYAPPLEDTRQAATPVRRDMPSAGVPDAARIDDGSTPANWQEVGEDHFEAVAFERLPDDEGLVAPLAERGTLRDSEVETQIAGVRSALPGWPFANEADRLQRTRNLLYIAAVPDLLQMDPLERHLPWLIFDRLRQDIPPRDLARILYWIAMHPEDGDDTAIGEIDALGLPQVAGPSRPVRERAMLYALKFLKRLEDQRRATVSRNST